MVSLFSTLAVADANSHKRTADELLVRLNVPTQLRAMADQAMAPLRIRLSRIKVSQEKADVVREHIRRLEALIYEAYSWENNRASYIEIYTNTYSEDELTALKEFFDSPAGSKFISPGPQFEQAMTNRNIAMANALKPQMTKIQQDLQVALTELRAAPEEQQ